MLRAVAALLLACQALPYSAVLFCTGHRQAEAACAEMGGTTLPSGAGAMHHEPSPGSHGTACPIAQLCTTASTFSLPALTAGPATPMPRSTLALPPAREAHAADATAPPLHPPKA